MKTPSILLCITSSFISLGQFESTLNQIKMYDKSEGLRIQNDFNMDCCRGQDLKWVDDLYWENIGGSFVRRIND